MMISTPVIRPRRGVTIIVSSIAWSVQRCIVIVPGGYTRLSIIVACTMRRRHFSAFRAAGCQASNASREITEIRVERNGDWILLDVMANAFLQHMVRNITGTLVAIGSGEQDVTWAARVLEGRDRTRAGMAAPPHGLTLVRVYYPDALGIPEPFELGQ